MLNSSNVWERIHGYPELKIINAQQLYKNEFGSFSELAFYKQLSRLEQEGQLVRLTRGMYCRPKKGRFGLVAASEKQILHHFLGTNLRSGVIVGYHMYNNYGLTTQVPKRVILYSNVVGYDKMNIQNITAMKASMTFDDATKKLIELLDVLENYLLIEDLSKKNMVTFIKNALKLFNDTKLEKVIRAIKVKKSTLASLKNTLDYFGIENNVSKYLSKTSKYKALSMEDLHEFTS